MERDRLIGAEHFAGGDAKEERVANLPGGASDGDSNRRLHDSIRMTNDECLMTKSIAVTVFRHSGFVISFGIRHSCFVIVLPLFSNSSRISRIRFRSVGLERSCDTLRCIRRTQFELAAVPGILKRYFLASRSVIITIANQDSLLKSASIIAG